MASPTDGTNFFSFYPQTTPAEPRYTNQPSINNGRAVQQSGMDHFAANLRARLPEDLPNLSFQAPQNREWKAISPEAREIPQTENDKNVAFSFALREELLHGAPPKVKTLFTNEAKALASPARKEELAADAFFAHNFELIEQAVAAGYEYNPEAQVLIKNGEFYTVHDLKNEFPAALRQPSASITEWEEDLGLAKRLHDLEVAAAQDEDFARRLEGDGPYTSLQYPAYVYNEPVDQLISDEEFARRLEEEERNQSASAPVYQPAPGYQAGRLDSDRPRGSQARNESTRNVVKKTISVINRFLK